MSAVFVNITRCVYLLYNIIRSSKEINTAAFSDHLNIQKIPENRTNKRVFLIFRMFAENVKINFSLIISRFFKTPFACNLPQNEL